MHSTAALPLPPHPDAEQYRTLAGELSAAVQAGDAAIEAWAHAWFFRLMSLAGERDQAPERIARDARRFAAYWTGARTVKDVPPPPPTLAHSQLIIARMHGFASWSSLLQHIDTLPLPDSGAARFEAAADAIVSGDIEALRRMLRERPDLVRARSSRAHGATLLHYVSANGVEGWRQKTPPNIVEITRLLIASGADVNATAICYGTKDDTLGLTATSMHPHKAGVMIPLLETLVAAGADVHHKEGEWGIIRGCLANGQPHAAHWLADHGADIGLAEGLGLGRMETVRRFLAPDGTLTHGATERQLAEGLRNASWYDQVDAIRYLLDTGFDAGRIFEGGDTALHHAAYSGNAELVSLLLERGSPVNVRDREHNGNALDGALWAWGMDNRLPADQSSYYDIVSSLRQAGEELKETWYTREGGKQVMDRVGRDQRMQAALAR